MFRRLRSLLFIVIAALVGAALGRIAAEVRRRQEAGEDPADIDFRSIRVRPADVVPGFVAAVRVHDQPWSWLHIPSWLAALGVNLVVGAVGGDLSRLREMAERAAFGLTGFEMPEDEDDTTTYEAYEAYTTAEAAPEPSFAPDPAVYESRPTSAPPPGDRNEPPRWRPAESESASASRPEREPPPGFTPFRD